MQMRGGLDPKARAVRLMPMPFCLGGSPMKQQFMVERAENRVDLYVPPMR
jgi:hypothetical protein